MTENFRIRKFTDASLLLTAVTIKGPTANTLAICRVAEK
jgi:hypothetical protein